MSRDIAIIGMAGRFPDARNVDELYINLAEGRDSVREISRERLKSTTLPPADEYRICGYLEDVDKFDHQFFNISLAEAQTMEPNQRLLLEVVYEIFENAAYRTDVFDGTNTCIYVAEAGNDYYKHAEEILPTLITGNAREFLAARIARQFNLRGTAAMVNTSCSSALVAVHLACNELILKDADFALVCAVNIDLFPYKDNSLNLGLLSPDGKSRAFSARANGMSRGEAAAGVLLKPLDKAVKDKDIIHAVIKGSAVNNNARSSASLSAPDSQTQAEVIKKAWERAKIDPLDVGFIEAHGSGTELGDSLEIEALDLAFKEYTDKKRFCPISTIKSNIGHGVFASGMLGLIEAVLSLKHKVIFPTIHFDTPNPLIDFEQSAVYVNDKLKRWKIEDGKPRIAGVSSIGFSGTNCHMILQEAPPSDIFEKNERTHLRKKDYIITISSKTLRGLMENLAALQQKINGENCYDLCDISFTLNKGRKHHDYRFACIADSLKNLKLQLAAGTAGFTPVEESRQKSPAALQKLIFILSYYEDIPDSLFTFFQSNYPLFKEYFKLCLACFTNHRNRNFRCFAFQYSFYRLLENYGIITENLLAIGIGQITSKVISGDMTLKEGVSRAILYKLEQVNGLEERVENLIQKETGEEPTIFIDLGTGSMIARELKKRETGDDRFYVFWLKQDLDNPDPFLQLLSSLYQINFDIDWDIFFKHHEGHKVELPGYQFKKVRCWLREEPAVLREDDRPASSTSYPLYEGGGEIEEKIAGFWREVLEIDKFYLEDDFFEKGGDSLKATKVIKQINEVFMLELDFEDMFDFPTIKSLGTYIDSLLSTRLKMALIWKEVLKVQKVDKGDNFFQLGGHSLLATQVLNRIKKEYHLELNFEDFFRHPTLDAICQYIDRLLVEGKNKIAYSSIEPIEKKEYHPLSSGQKRLYLLQYMDRENTSYNGCEIMMLDGELQEERLAATFRELIRRHDSFRTSFEFLGVEPVQRVHGVDAVKFEIEYYSAERRAQSEERKELNNTEGEDLCHAPLAMRHTSIIDRFIRPFDLSGAPLLRVGLIKTGEEKHLLLLDVHHIITDGTSMVLLAKEFMTVYEGHLLPSLRIQYKDFAQWQNKEKERPVFKQQEDFWFKEFASVIPVLNLPTDHPRPRVQSFAGSFVDFFIDSQESGALKKLAIKEDVTLYMILLTVLNIFLHKLSDQEDINIGTAVAGRRHVDLQQLMGLFVNTLVLRNHPVSQKTVAEFLKEIRERTLTAFENQDYPFEDLVENVLTMRDKSHNPLFDVMFGFQNIAGLHEKKPEIKLSDLKLKSYPFDPGTTKFDLTLIGMEDGDKLYFTFEYSTHLFKKETIEHFIVYFKNIVSSVLDSMEQRISEIEILSNGGREQLLYAFNDTGAEYPGDKTIHRLFEEQVERTPDHIVLVGPKFQISNPKYRKELQWGPLFLTYREFDCRSNQLFFLLRAKGVQFGTPVGILVEPSIEMMTGIFAILKAGGAYLPIDANIPENRIIFILEDSGTSLIISKASILEKYCLARLRGLHTAEVRSAREILLLDETDQRLPMISGKSCKKSKHNPEHFHRHSQPAYMIYTSGSMGKPKGVIIEHQSLVNLCYWHNTYYSVTSRDRALKYAGSGFDASVWEIFPYLIVGAALYIVEEASRLDIRKLNRYLEMNNITIGFLPTQIAEQFMSLDNCSLRVLLTGGDKLSRYIPGDYQLANNYGPTENAVVTTSFNVNGSYTNIPIGKPIFNTAIYIVNSNNQLQPIGTAGELCICGNGLARGYLNNPELTAEKFVIPDVEQSGSRFYRTGDMARWLADGNIEFLGRNDQQVKIRGYRIELSEIESRLLQHEEVKEVVVISRQREKGDRYLCAYIVWEDGGEPQTDITELQEYLSDQLPYYMVPAYFVVLKQLPLTSSGKINRGALPEPLISNDYEAPAGETEENLVLVWQQVMGVERVGIRDNFFEIGGDSIKAIQVSSQLINQGFQVEVSDIFSYPFIKELARHVKKLDQNQQQQIPQGEVQGTVPLTPIQRWFFGNNFPEPHHFNQAVMLEKQDRFKENFINEIFTKLVDHHDALRMVYQVQEQPQGHNPKVIQKNRGLEVEERWFDLEVINLEEIEEKPGNIIERESNRIQRSIDLKRGPLVKLGLFKAKEKDYLLIVIHHLVVDGVSWRILLEDIEMGYRQLEKGEEIRFQPKTHSFKEWSWQLSEYAGSSRALSELEYWHAVDSKCAGIGELAGNDSIYRRNRSSRNTGKTGNTGTVTLTLTEEQTKQLLREVNRAYNTEINDILLSALGLGLYQWSGVQKVIINLEGHGREPILDGINTRRTIGWFTSLFPVVLEMEPAVASVPGLQVKHIKEMLRRIPNKGIGYGILKYLTPLEKKNDVSFNSHPEISFNYLGQFDRETGVEGGLFKVSRRYIGNEISSSMQNLYLLFIYGMVTGEKFILFFDYNKDEYRKEAIEQLVEHCQSNLTKIIRHCLERGERELTPADIGYLGFSLDSLTELQKRFCVQGKSIQDIYPLSPMQKGMLFHSWMEGSEEAYIEQAVLSLEGEINHQILERSFQLLVERYDIFRTVFVYEELEEPVQIVLRSTCPDIRFSDISHRQESEKASFIETMKRQERARGFDLTGDNLLRVFLLKTGVTSYKLIITFHHIIMDGWCLGIVFKDLGIFYQSMRAANRDEEPIKVESTIPYKNYIRWLENQFKDVGLRYWKNYLSGYQQAAVLPKSRRENSYRMEVYQFTIGEYVMADLKRLAQQYQVTINTLFQTLWGILLQEYNNVDDVVYGVVVSGRSADIHGIAHMVGLFINTIPVRIRSEQGKTFLQLIHQVQQDTIQAKHHEYLPLSEIQAQSLLNRELIDHILVFENYPMGEQLKDADIFLEKSTGFKVTEVENHEQTNYDFNIVVVPGDMFLVKFNFNSSVFDIDMIERLALHLRNLVAQVVREPILKLEKIEIISSQEKRKILDGFNDTDSEYSGDKSIHRVFAEQVEKTPDHMALIGQITDQKLQISNKKVYLSYRELNKKSNQLAHLLEQKGLVPDTTVGIMVKRSTEMIIGILGILKASGSYLPLDPDYPDERIVYMLKDSSAKVLLTTRSLSREVEKLRELEVETVLIEEISIRQALPSKIASNKAQPITNPMNIAYVIYTSGSTGKPKGVMVEHRSVVNRLNWMQKAYPITGSDVILQKTPYTFDVSVWELFWWGLTGALLCLLAPGEEKDPVSIMETMIRHHITTMHFVPSMLKVFLDYLEDGVNEIRCRRLRQVFASGESLDTHHMERFNRFLRDKIGTRLINLYGPTEATVDVSYFNCPGSDSLEPIKRIPIGKPIDNIKLYITDRNLRMQGVGIIGELCIAGVGLARGYLNQPELTAEKFVAAGISDHSSPTRHLLYRTGDLARWQPDGNIEFLGRIDHQVKIRGFRIELEEIAHQIVNHAAVSEAVVVDWIDNSGDSQLAAYVVPDSRYAFPILQQIRFHRQGNMDHRNSHEWPNGMTIFYLNRSETDFMYREIFEEKSYIKHGITLAPGACVFDVGANIGMFSLFVNQMCSGAEIYAFEPIPPIFDVLSLNADVYGDNIRVFPYGLSSIEKEGVFTYYPHASVLSSRFADKDQDSKTVQTFINNEQLTKNKGDQLSDLQVAELLQDRLAAEQFTCHLKPISRVIKETKVDRIDLLKIDVEKCEIDVLEGIEEADWAKIRQLVIEVHDIDGRLKGIREKLEKRGYRVVVAQDSSLKNTDLYNVYGILPEQQQEKPVREANPPMETYNRWSSSAKLIENLRAFLNMHLPDYMVPSVLVLLDELPLTANGKINRRALPDPGSIKNNRLDSTAPGNEREEKLAEIWSDVLGIKKENIGIHINFFQSGGQSLKAAVLRNRIHKVFDVKIPLGGIFQHPTIKRMADFIQDAAKDKYMPVQLLEKRGCYPLSSAQKRLYILQQMAMNNIAYNLPAVMEVSGDIHLKRFERAIRRLIDHHESLRTSFHVISDQPVQRIHPQVEFEIEYHSPERKPSSEKLNEERCEPCAIGYSNTVKDFIRPFDLSRAPLLRVGLIKTSEAKNILMIDMHHIIMDGISLGIFIKEFMSIYSGEEMPVLRHQYKDFLAWQTREKGEKEIIKQEEYWKKQFEGEIPVLKLPADYNRPLVSSFEGRHVNFQLGNSETKLLKDLAVKERASLFMVLLSVFNVFLFKITGQEDIVVGTPVAGRRHADMQQIIGMFVNTLALRNYPAGEKKFREFLREVKERTLTAFENQDYQFEDLAEQVKIIRDTGRNPIFSVMLGLQNMELPEVEMAGLKLQSLEHTHRGARFDMTWSGREDEDEISFMIEYGTKLFTEATIKRYIKYFKRIVSFVAQNTDVVLGAVEIIDDEERRKLLVDFNDTGPCNPQRKLLHELFEEQVEKTPEFISLVGLGEKSRITNSNSQIPGYELQPSIGVQDKPDVDRSYFQHIQITYRELNQKANQLAHFLKEKGVVPETIVSIRVERSLDMVIGIFGILKAGGAYLPIEPGSPEHRATYILADSAAQLLLSRNTYMDVPGEVCETVNFCYDNLYKGETNNLPQVNTVHDAMYMLYTSGSTGNPKGVVVEHGPVVNIISNLFKEYPFWGSDVYLFKTSYVFDVSISEIFGWFLGGGRLALLDAGAEKDPGKILHAIEIRAVSHINFVPSMFNVFVEFLNRRNIGRLSGVRYIFLAGETLSARVINKFRNLGSKAALENIYGPTEATIYASKYSLSGWVGKGNIPIGKPLQNVKLFILTSYNYLQPVGIAGELCISGKGLARGYLNRPALTNSRFQVINYRHFTNPKLQLQIADQDEKFRQNIYRTGDLVRWHPDGNIEFLGRIDHQVKIRGFRIELGEIESRLTEHKLVREAVVVAKEKKDEGGEKYLCAYIVAKVSQPGAEGEESGKPPNAELRGYLSQVLPDYMIPSYFVFIKEIPLTPAGKIDRKVLPEPEIKSHMEYVAPRNDLEKKLVEIWAWILNIDRVSISIDDNFFELGGHSLKITKLLGRIYKEFHIEVPFTMIFKRSTVRELSAYINQKEKGKYSALKTTEKKEYYPLSPAQKRLYVLQQMDDKSCVYNMPGVMKIEGEIEKEKFEQVFIKLIGRHESLRTSFVVIDKNPVQKIHNPIDIGFEIEYYSTEYRALSAVQKEWLSESEEARCADIIETFIRPFNLSHAPLLRVGLLKPEQDELILMVDMHHIISDGASLGILIRECISLFKGEDLAALPFQYKDYSEWLSVEQENEAIKRKGSFWQKEFSGEIPVLCLPTDFPRPVIQEFDGERIDFEVCEEKVEVLKALALEENATLYMILLALFNILLARLSGQEDIVVGTPVAGRRHEDLSQILGKFVNTLALRNYPSGEKRFRYFVREVRDRTSAAFENQEYQFEDLVGKVAVNRDISHNPLFDVMFVIQDLDVSQVELPDLQLNPYKYSSKISKFDMTFICQEMEKSLHFTIEYSTRLFKKETIGRFINYFKNIISCAVDDPGRRISEIEILSRQERRQILEEFNHALVEYPFNTITDLFEEQVTRTPDKNACFDKGNNLTYRVLNNRGNELARIIGNL